MTDNKQRDGYKKFKYFSVYVQEDEVQIGEPAMEWKNSATAYGFAEEVADELRKIATWLDGK